MLTEENKKDILDNFLETIQSISDMNYQRRAWIRGEPPGTDFDETVNSYYLDSTGILKNHKDFKITNIQLQILQKFDKQFRLFSEQNIWPPDFIDSLEWTEITEMAKEVLKAFHYQA